MNAFYCYNGGMKRRLTVRGIILLEGKLLCVRLKPYNRKSREFYWCTPGGGIDFGESAHAALEREMIEETGVKPKVGNLLYIQQFKEKDTGNEQFELFFNVLNPQDYVNIDLLNTTHGEEEIEEIDFVDPSKNHILPKFLTTENFNNLDNQQTKIFNYL